MDHIIIYTDGGSDPNPGPGGWGVVLVHPKTKETRELSGGEASTTNNRMELTAAIQALESLPDPCRVELFTDSQYLKKGITEWLAGWEKRGWRKADGNPVLNGDLWKRLASASRRHKISWAWVKGHSGNRYNDRADELATAALRRRGGAPAATSAAADPGPAADIEVFLKVSGSRRGGWAALVRRGAEEEMAEGAYPGASANRLDVLAATEVLRGLPGRVRVAVYTGSDYLRNGATQWLHGWRHRGWKTASGAPVKNAAEWRRLASQLERLNVLWPSVKGRDVPEWKALARRLKRSGG